MAALCWALRNSRIRLLQCTVVALESRKFQAYCQQTVQLALDFHCDSCHCRKLWRKVQGLHTVTLSDNLPSTRFILTTYGEIDLSLKACHLVSVCSHHSQSLLAGTTTDDKIIRNLPLLAMLSTSNDIFMLLFIQPFWNLLSVIVA